MEVGDYIVELDGEAVADASPFFHVESGATVKLALDRGDQQLTVSLTVP